MSTIPGYPPASQSTLEAVAFLRTVIATTPKFGNWFEVINMDTLRPDAFVADLDDGTSIRVSVERYVRPKEKP